MPDPVARKRLKNKMLDRWENEGGAIPADATTANDTCLPNQQKGQRKKRSTQRDTSTPGAPASSTKKPMPTRK